MEMNMNMLTRWIPIAILLLGALPQLASANELVASCNGCDESGYASAPHDYAAVQQELHRENPWWFPPLQPTTYYVYDLPNRQVRAYAIIPNGSHAFSVQPTSVPPDFGAAAAYLSDVYSATGGTMKFSFDFNADPAYLGNMSGFDVARPGAAQYALTQWIWNGVQQSQPLTVFSAQTYALSTAVLNLVVANDVETLIKVTFPDGTSVMVKFNYLQGGATVIPGTARDVLGNLIPANDEEAVGNQYAYNGNDPTTTNARHAMLTWLIGLRQSYPNLSCSWDGTTLTCSRR
jgi:hypothetical protein